MQSSKRKRAATLIISPPFLTRVDIVNWVFQHQRLLRKVQKAGARLERKKLKEKMAARSIGRPRGKGDFEELGGRLGGRKSVGGHRSQLGRRS